MIAFLKGNFVNKTPANVVVEVNGVGYDVQISLNTFSAISQLDNGLLYTHLQITENAHTLFGFATINEKLLFLQLIAVSGVGASTARMMLSGMKPEEIIKAIVQSNTAQLEKIKGIGRKSAERLIVELKDKLAKLHDINVVSGLPTMPTVASDAVDALIALGIGKSLAEATVKKTMKEADEHITLEMLIKLSLKNL
ncbi:MAG TPA: Holliday junction branch migration protein RuvA [Arachidicoccus soli]|uniref:Holliday junction branch migration complex subunit RuvA n=1 Tax=Arachidicoccus soli TaxID=2341117 RepID=A0A386HSB3_9BACT|nr:Holliday junction branch migration protein RuvA [Arachidicoccus soli]AYD48582.1 Holliday junction branch migration protein RuvA [Arachidicoccus soli]HEU0227239.1 Holliday junction branch migration protein RuvA [Arachidicoccus soli]